MKFKEILRFELYFQLRQVTNWLYIIVILFFTVMAALSMIDNVKEGEYFLNSPVIISFIAAVSSMFGLLLAAAVAGSTAVRDIQTRMDPLIYTSSLKKLSYLSARFLVAFVINLMVITLTLVLLYFGSYLSPLEEFFSTSNVFSFLDAFLLFAVPNAFLNSGILFSLSLITRKSLAGYLGAGLLFFISLMTMDIIAGELGLWDIGKKLDPSGLTVLKELRLTQTPLENKQDFIPLSSSLLVNRLIWIGAACSFLLLAYWRFNFIHIASGCNKHWTKSKKSISTEKERSNWSTHVYAPTVAICFDFNTKLRQVKYLALTSFSKMIKEKVWFLIIITAFILVVASEEMLEGQLGVPIFPTTWRVLELLNFLAVTIVTAMLISFYAGELVWKERDTRINEMTDVSPVPDWVLFISKLISLNIMIAFIQIIFLFTGLLIQILQGYYNIDLGLYIKVLLGFRFIDLFLFSIVALAIHVLVNQKYIGHLLVFVTYYYMRLPDVFGLDHHLLIYGSDPGLPYSEISGFDPHIVPWLWFKLYWISWAGALALLIYLFWNRGNEINLSKRITKAKLHIPGTVSRIGIPTILTMLLVGGFILYNTNILNIHYTSDEAMERRALYELKYGKFDRIPQPLLRGIKLMCEIYPESRTIEIEGIYKLINKAGVDIDTIHVNKSTGTEIPEMKFSKSSHEVLIDDDLGHRIYKLNTPLKPGDSITMEFKVIIKHKGFSNWGIDNTVVQNGTYMGYHLMPDIGYETDREISDSIKREKYNLTPKSAVRSVYDKQARMDLFGEQQLSFDAILGTSIDQTAVTAGSLQRTWVEKGRRYFHYKTNAPIRHNYEIFSADYKVHKAKWKNVKINIYYHDKHGKNVARMAHAMVASLEYYSKHFSDYPYGQLNLVEYPRSGVGLNGNPITMSYSEGFSFFQMEKERRDLDFPFAVIAHEVAHQWWGGLLRPAYVEGSALLTESLAWYSAIMVVEKTYGLDHLERLVRILRNEYLTPRSAADVPLLKATDRFSAYRKGPFAMYALKEYVGGENVNVALNRLLRKFEPGQPPLPTSLDLYTELKSVTPDSLQYLLGDLFERNTFWKLKANKATVEKVGNDVWEVSFDFVTKKVAIDEKGRETEYQMNDYVEIAIYSNSPEGDLGELLYLRKHQLSSGLQTLKIKVSKEPDLAGIDPNRLLIDQQIYDNFAPIKK